MAQLALGVAGSAMGGALLGSFSFMGATLSGAQIGGMLGSFAGAAIDDALSPGRSISRTGPRLSDINIQGSTEGAPIPRLYGRMRLAGQVIWASQFRETVATTSDGGVSETQYTYALSFAVGLCEGVATRLGRVWANGALLDLSQYTLRFHTGGEDQMPDPLIAEIEGADNAPGHRGLCYVVFEDMALAAFGNRMPQLHFEVWRSIGNANPDSLESRLGAVALIPGAGEFVYADVPVYADDGYGGTRALNSHGVTGEADMLASLDDLQASAPNMGAVSLVVGWFGDDLRAGHIRIRPGVEDRLLTSYPDAWSVNGQVRGGAHELSRIGDRPAYGGTPSDASVVQAIAALQARGLRVLFNPFIFMDVAADNALIDPVTGAAPQPPYPWRGRITSAADGSALAATQVAQAFGTASAAQFAVDGTNVTWTGGDDWGLRRMVLHYAHLCAAAGGVEAFLIGSEMRGLTSLRDGAGDYPAVAALKTLAADVRAILGSGTKIGYGADWSEYNNHQLGDGDVVFHLDPLWADVHIDFIGIDNYMPLADWRDGAAHADTVLASSTYAPEYLAGNICGGEGFDWYYASDADRAAQVRTPISDGLGKPWVWRAKDIRRWWSNAHYNRMGGVESAPPTAWVPQSKPVWFTELGCPAIDRGANQPNVFVDPKSSESAMPHFSSGARDDLIQRRFLEAHLNFWREAANNPVSTITGQPMLDTANIYAWCWDARPFPEFPGLASVWGDAGNYTLGHWLNGRLGAVPLGELVAMLCREAGLQDTDVSELDGMVTGFAITQAMSARDALAPLALAFFFDAVESQGRIRFRRRGAAMLSDCDRDGLALPERGDGLGLSLVRAQESDLPQVSRVAYIDGDHDYRQASVESRRLTGGSNRVADSSLPLVLDQAQAAAIGTRLLQDAWAMRESASFALPPSRLALDPADEVLLDSGARSLRLRLTRIEDAGMRAVEALATDPSLYESFRAPARAPALAQSLVRGGRVLLFFLDLPWLHAGQNTAAPLVAAYADPWPGDVALLRSSTGENYARDALLTRPASFGVLQQDFWSGPRAHWDRVNSLRVKMVHGALASADPAALFGGANRLAVQNGDGGWEVVQFATAALVGPDEYVLTGLLRGRHGSESQMRDPVAAGASVVVLDNALVGLGLRETQARLAFHYQWGPLARPVSDASWQTALLSFAGAAQIPLAPCHVGFQWEGGDLVITWRRRDRAPSAFSLLPAQTAMSEASERYDLDILDGASVVRSFASITEHSQRYTLAQQAADFPSGLPSPLGVRVTQLSALVGRGHTQEETLYVG